MPVDPKAPTEENEPVRVPAPRRAPTALAAVVAVIVFVATLLFAAGVAPLSQAPGTTSTSGFSGSSRAVTPLGEPNP